jgi:hypothetical protein
MEMADIVLSHLCYILRNNRGAPPLGGGGEGKTIVLGALAWGLKRAVSVSLLAKLISSPGEEGGVRMMITALSMMSGGGAGAAEMGGAARPNSQTWQGSCDSSQNST